MHVICRQHVDRPFIRHADTRSTLISGTPVYASTADYVEDPLGPVGASTCCAILARCGGPRPVGPHARPFLEEAVLLSRLQN